MTSIREKCGDVILFGWIRWREVDLTGQDVVHRARRIACTPQANPVLVWLFAC